MQSKLFQILELQQSRDGVRRIQIPFTAPVSAGQYFLASNPTEVNASLPITLFPSQASEEICTLVGAIPDTWQPGTELKIEGPLGKGFEINQDSNRIVLVGLDKHVARFEILMAQAELEIALFTDSEPVGLPIWVEVNPLAELAKELAWGDQIFVDLPSNDSELLNPLIDSPFRSKTQVLFAQEMPCGGKAQCGVCAIQLFGTKKWHYPCEKGAVIQLP